MNEDDDMMKDLLKLEYEAKLIDKAENQFIKKEESTVVGQQESTNIFAERFQKRQEFKKKIRDSTKVSPTFLREDAGKVWNDASLSEWPENDYRIMVLGLHQACTDDKLYDAFKHYKSIVKAHVVHDTSNRGKHYGFVSLMDVNDYIKAMKEMDGGFVENAKVHLQPSKWKDKSLKK